VEGLGAIFSRFSEERVGGGVEEKIYVIYITSKLVMSFRPFTMTTSDGVERNLQGHPVNKNGTEIRKYDDEEEEEEEEEDDNWDYGGSRRRRPSRKSTISVKSKKSKKSKKSSRKYKKSTKRVFRKKSRSTRRR